MASPSATSPVACSLVSWIAYQVRGISRFPGLGPRLRNNQSSSVATSSIAQSVGFGRCPLPLPTVSPAAAAGNPRNYYSGLVETCSPRHLASIRGLDFSSRVHSWGAPPPRNVLQLVAGGRGLLSGGGQQLRKIFVEVKGNDLERAIRKWRRKCKEEKLRNLKDREYYKKPSEKRVIALKERDRRIAKRSFKMKLNWILSRRQRGF